MATWTDAGGQRVRVAETGNTAADRRAMVARLPDLLAAERATGAFLRLLVDMRERQERIVRQ